MSGIAVLRLPQRATRAEGNDRCHPWRLWLRAWVAGVAVAVGLAAPFVLAAPAAAATGTFAYVTNSTANNVSVIATATNTVTATIPVGTNPIAVAITVVRARTIAECPVGTVITGGGFELVGPPPSDLTSKPVDDTWEVALTNGTTSPIAATPYAVCADNTP
ncbi:hypothetical protein ACWCYZ_33065 [Streptomyces virginiae]